MIVAELATTYGFSPLSSFQLLCVMSSPHCRGLARECSFPENSIARRIFCLSLQCESSYEITIEIVTIASKTTAFSICLAIVSPLSKCLDLAPHLSAFYCRRRGTSHVELFLHWEVNL